MSEETLEEKVNKVIAQIRHPTIARTLTDLGIVKNVMVNGKKVTVTLAFPFPNIPIKDYLIGSVKEPVEKLGAEVDVKVTVMSQEEIQKFLIMEQESWEG
ncbi:DUF59 domain-containing protein [Candidatus Aerophobetes bacterium]|nr:DUF59 domain-containing protein [Candidatus Aerophobetes bacterium]